MTSSPDGASPVDGDDAAAADTTATEAAPLSRRRILGAGLVAALGLGSSACRRQTAVARTAVAPGGGADVDLDVALRAVRDQVAFSDNGAGTARVWRFQGDLLRGPRSALVTDKASYLGPTFRVRPGQRVRVNFENKLPEDSIVHWHGLDVSEANDGHPRLAVGTGGRRSYDFVVGNRAGTYWYHPHPDMRTGFQVYAGMAGLFIVSDGADQARGLPADEFELPLVLQDRVLDDAGQLVYQPNPMMGLLGDRPFVNGRLEPRFDVREGSYRLRLLNGSNARIFKLGWSDGSPIVALASDGGLLARPQVKPYLMLAPGERAEIWADFGRRPGGGDVQLRSLPFYGGGMGGMGMGMGGGGRGRGGGGIANGAAFPVCRFVVRGTGTRLEVPVQFEPLAFLPAEAVVNAALPRQFPITMAMMRWMLNGQPFQMNDVAANEHIKRGVVEDWEFVNPGGMMAMPHPIHIHGGQFQVVARTVAPDWQDAASTVAAGLLDQGWKDTFLVMPGERIRVRVRFANHAGLFLYHCHNLEHEDMGMMRNFRVEA